MAATTQTQPVLVGQVVRQWRRRRRLSQMELALEAGVSTRHLSFVETGRSRPGRELLLRVLGRLEVPLREQNRLLLSCGHAPALPERAFEDPGLAPLRAALDAILAAHEPSPAMVVDRTWNVVAVNRAVAWLTRDADVDPLLLEPPVNAVRVSLHPRGLAPYISDLGAWRAFFRERLERQLALTADEDLAALLEELETYGPADRDGAGPDPGEALGPLRVRSPAGELAFFGMFATFDLPFDVTMAELAVEFLFPADEVTRQALHALDDDRGGPR